ncbi:MAG: enoyl-CoA hydratase/isomerase family protein [Candidatus Stahlbacteria bacterium]|nr:enoyl-CoA hydratase/isomerase family protein [Candidatus Stahlbacteria bacterium]
MGDEILSRKINSIGIVGSGNIGPDIALYFSQMLSKSNIPIIVVDISEQALALGKTRTANKIGSAVKKGVLTQDAGSSIISNILWTTDYSELKAADLVIEAATESIGIKRKIFAGLEKICSEKAIFASNSSHMEPSVIFADINKKDRCLVIHYFFPADRNMIVEIVPSNETAEEVMDFAMNFYEQLGKVPIKVKSSYGYAIDPIFEGLFLASALIVERGVGSVKEIDVMVQKALGMGIGPFTAMNLTGGNPLSQHGLNEMHTKSIPWYRSPKLLDDLLALGKPWDTPKRGEVVKYKDSTYKQVADEIMGAYFGLVCNVLDLGITNIGDFEMALETALVMNPPFKIMNELGVEKALWLVQSYNKKYPEFPVPNSLLQQSASGNPFPIPVVFREDKDEIAVVTIRRPKVLNALNSDVISQLQTIFTEIQADKKITAAVLTGFGTKAFVSGADINELAALRTPIEGEALSLRGQEVLNLIENLGKPVICAMNGLAFGGGNELAMACTTRIAKKGIKVLAGQPEPKLGIIPGYGGTQRLPRIVGLDKAWAILRTGNPISSAEALAIGLISSEINGDIKEAGVELAKKVAQGTVKLDTINKEPITVPLLPEVNVGTLSRKIDELLQKAILGGACLTLSDGLKQEAKTFSECLLTKDMRIGMESFKLYGPKRVAPFSHS